MNIYRLKHKLTGLYYQPGKNNLSKKGKIYTTNSNIITLYNNNPFIIGCKFDSQLYKQTKDILNWEKGFLGMIIKVSPDDFEKEYLTTE